MNNMTVDIKLKIGMVIEYKNLDDDFKKAVITQIFPGGCEAITFSGRCVSLKNNISCWIPGRNDGIVSSVLGNNIDEFLALGEQ